MNMRGRGNFSDRGRSHDRNSRYEILATIIAPVVLLLSLLPDPDPNLA